MESLAGRMIYGVEEFNSKVDMFIRKFSKVIVDSEQSNIVRSKWKEFAQEDHLYRYTYEGMLNQKQIEITIPLNIGSNIDILRGLEVGENHAENFLVENVWW